MGPAVGAPVVGPMDGAGVGSLFGPSVSAADGALLGGGSVGV